MQEKYAKGIVAGARSVTTRFTLISLDHKDDGLDTIKCKPFASVLEVNTDMQL